MAMNMGIIWVVVVVYFLLMVLLKFIILNYIKIMPQFMVVVLL